LGDDESLALFLKQMAKLDRRFCEVMADKVDYTLKLEIHGNAGKMIHCRVTCDEFARPKGSKNREAEPS